MDETQNGLRPDGTINPDDAALIAESASYAPHSDRAAKHITNPQLIGKSVVLPEEKTPPAYRNHDPNGPVAPLAPGSDPRD